MSFLSRLKALDVYGEIPQELSEQTVSGATLSVTAIALLVILFFSELSSYVYPNADQQLIIQQHSLAPASNNHGHATVTAHLNMTLYAVPCGVLHVVQQDMYGAIPTDTMRMLIKADVNEYGHPTAIHEDASGCNVYGSMRMEMVPGNFHFTSTPMIYQLTRGMHGGMINMSHTIHYLFFGEMTRRDVRHERINIEMDALHGRSRIVTAPQNGQPITYAPSQSKSFEYFLKIVSTQYESHSSGRRLQTYQYVAHSNELVVQKLMPAIYFRMDFSPVTVVISYDKYSFAHFCVQCCAIMGGVFAVLRMIHGTVVSARKTVTTTMGGLSRTPSHAPHMLKSSLSPTNDASSGNGAASHDYSKKRLADGKHS